jgi:hypothetical protein
MDPADAMDQAEQREVCGRRSDVDAVVEGVAAVADVAARHAVVVVAESGSVSDGAAIRKGSRVVVWQTFSFPRHRLLRTVAHFRDRA